MIRFLKRRRAIKQFVMQLPLDLHTRFGGKRHYSVEEVDRATTEKFNRAFLAYAHALFCTRGEFDGYYGGLKLASTYDSLRRTVAKRFFGGIMDFDAASLYAFARKDIDFDPCEPGLV